MESNDQEDFVSQEVDLPVPEHDNSLGVGRSYECVFCKRGFNTAQALGGHMNIHRKDRARNKPSSVVVMNSNKHIEENYSVINPRFYHQTNISTSYQPHYVASHHHYDQPQFNHRSSYFPASAASPAQPFFPNHQRFNPFGFDQWSMSFSMPCGSSAHVEDIEKSRRGVSQEEELDLELRLGGP